VRVDGGAGIGKTRLLDEVALGARGSGLTILRAAGGEFERGFPFGVVRQLFEPPLADMSPGRRRALLTDAAALAAPLFGQGSPADAEGDRSFAVLHGLYWLTAKLAARSPLAIVVDDAHWADAPSIRFIAYLTRRLDDVPVALILASRPNEPGRDPALERLWGEVTPLLTIELVPLSAEAVAALVRETLDADASEALCEACHAATAGNPFYLRELIAGLLERRSWSPEEISEVTTGRVWEAVRRRLSALGPDAAGLARALAILRRGSELRIAALLAGLEVDAATVTADALRAVGVLAGSPPDFVHPIVRGAVIAGLSIGQRTELHARAAEQLARDGADCVEVARHLLEAEPSGRLISVARLRAGAREAIARGAPGAGAAFLRRAEREPPTGAERATVLFELGQAEVLDRDPTARDDLTAALNLTTDPVEAGRIALLLADVLLYSGSVAEAIDVADTAIDRLADSDPEIATRLEAFAAWWTAIDARFAGGLERRLPRLRKVAEAGGPTARPVLLVLGALAGLRTGDSGEVLQFVHRGLDDGRLLAEETSDSHAVFLAIAALSMVDELDELERLIVELQGDARRRGSVLGHTITAAWRGYSRLRRGRVAEALDDLRSALALTEEHELRIASPAVLAWWAEAMHEAGDPVPAAATLDAVELAELEHNTSGSMLLHSRGLVRAGLGWRDEAAADLRRCGATMDAVSWRNPNVLPWRSTLAGVIAASEPDEARDLVVEELELARVSAQPRAIGRAMHARALLEAPVDVEGLRAAVAELERSPARLELARALTDLGAALCRANHRRDAREPLRRALDIAHRGGAVRAAERAREELVVAGGRPRRMAARGADALTPSELRVSRLAVEGLSNPEIAQALFVSRKAVEMHLTNAYRKLEIHSRAELPRALEANNEPASGEAG
jgi:DNA-binding CsgD family transcriptional regulator